MLLNTILSFATSVGKIGGTPYKRDKGSLQLYSDQSRLQLLRFITLVEAIWILFVYYQCIRFKLEGNIDGFNTLFTFFLGSILIIIVFLIHNLYHRDFVGLLNAYFHLMYRLEDIRFNVGIFAENYMPDLDHRTARSMKALEFLIWYIIISMTASGFLMSLMSIVVPSTPILPTCLIPPDVKFGIILKMILLPFQMFVPLVVNGSLSLTMIVIVVYTATVVPFFTNELRIGMGQYKTKNSLRTPKNLMVTFRSFQLLHQTAMSCFGVFIVPCQTTFSNMILFSNFMFIRHRAEMQPETNCLLIGWSTICLLFWMLVLELGGRLHLRGREVLKSWKLHDFGDKSVNRCMSRFRTSCRPLAIQFGRTYVIRRLSVLKFIRGLTVGTFRLLLAVDEYY
ncbi:unnamed protein product [Orchesella dallaii]|uniref:Odorant receptor n=1 Tax=Orchesella dallaii TaxID=48710 RepID=A0ABP1Q3Z4_9HEXA